MRRQANSSLLFTSRHFLLAMFPSITSASSRLDKLVGGKAEKYGTRLFRYLLLYLPWYSFLFFFSFLYVFIRSIFFSLFFSFFLPFRVCFPPLLGRYLWQRISISLQVRTGPQGSRTLRLKGFSTMGATWRWQACQLHGSAAFNTGIIPGTVKRLGRTQSHLATGGLKSVALLGIELATFRLSTLCLYQLRHRLLQMCKFK